MILPRKKAQIAIFIVIGVIVILGGFFLLSNNTSFSIFQEDSPGFKTTQSIDEFVTQCIEIQTKEGINLLGRQGGWIEPQGIFADRNTPGIVVEKAEGIEFAGDQFTYWYYYDDRNEVFRTKIPSYDDLDDENSMLNQLKYYIEDNINLRCLNNFENFEDVSKIEFEEPQINVEFGDEIIKVELEMPIQIEHINLNKTDYLDVFNIEYENKLRIPYYLAKDIVSTQSQNSLFEKNLIAALIPYQSSVDTQLLPPFSDTRSEYEFRVWRVDESKLLTQMVMESTVPQTQFRETNYRVLEIEEELRDLPLAQGLTSVFVQEYFGENGEYKDQELDSELERDYRAMNLNPTYSLLYPINFEIENSYGGMIFMSEPEMLVPFLGLSTTDYQAAYKIVAPIIIDIKDSRDQINDDFVFKLPIEINIRHNAPLAENYEINIPNTQTQIDGTIACRHLNSGDYSINLTDSIKGGGVEGAFVEVKCKQGFFTCPLGQTRIVNGITNLNFKIPQNCYEPDIPATLTITKFGHQGIEKEIYLDEQDFGVVDMPSAKEMKLKVVSSYNDWVPGRSYSTMTQGEEGILVFESLDDESMTRVFSFDEFTTYYESEGDVGEIQILPGRYNIQGFIFKQDETNQVSSRIIPCDSSALGSLLGADCPSESQRTMPAFNLSAWVVGHYQINDFEFELNDLIENDYIVLNLIRVNMPQTYDQLAEQSEVTQDIERLSNLRKPTFCKTEDIDKC